MSDVPEGTARPLTLDMLTDLMRRVSEDTAYKAEPHYVHPVTGHCLTCGDRHV